MSNHAVAVVTVEEEPIASTRMNKGRIGERIVVANEEAEIVKQKKQEEQEVRIRRKQILQLLQRHSVSIHSLQLLSDQETRHEENGRAIPEGNEDDDDDDDDTDSDNHDDSREKTTTLSLSDSSSMASTIDLDYSSSSSSDSDYSNHNTEKGERQIERRRRQRRNVFRRMTRFVVVAVRNKSTRC